MKTFDLGSARHVRRPSLTPLIDVVFLLLVFFMLVARFGFETALPLDGAASGELADWEGPPRLVDLGSGDPNLNGVAIPLDALAEKLAPLMLRTDSPILLRTGAGADVQALADVLTRLKAAGYTRLVVID